MIIIKSIGIAALLSISWLLCVLLFNTYITLIELIADKFNTLFATFVGAFILIFVVALFVQIIIIY